MKYLKAIGTYFKNFVSHFIIGFIFLLAIWVCAVVGTVIVVWGAFVGAIRGRSPADMTKNIKGLTAKIDALN